MTRVQEFIDCFSSIEEAVPYLKRNLGIDCKHYIIDSGTVDVWMCSVGNRAELDDPLVRESSMMVLDDHNYLLAKPWNLPFVVENSSVGTPDGFNFGRDCIAYDVPDGTIVMIYNIDGKWMVASPNDPEGQEYLGATPLPTLTYEFETKSTLNNMFGLWTNAFRNVNPHLCFIFSFVSPYDLGVMPIQQPELTLMGVTNLETGQQLTFDNVDRLANQMGFPRVNWRAVSSSTGLHNRLMNMRALAPGLMVEDKEGERMFIPNPIYKAVQRALLSGDRANGTHMATIVQSCRDKADKVTVSVAYECFAKMLDLLWAVRVDMWHELSTLWNCANEFDGPEFAKLIDHHPLKHILHLYKKGKIHSIKDELYKLKPHKLAEITQMKWEKEFELAQQLLKFNGGNSYATSNQEESDQEENIQGGDGTEEGCIPFSVEGD